MSGKLKPSRSHDYLVCMVNEWGGRKHVEVSAKTERGALHRAKDESDKRITSARIVHLIKADGKPGETGYGHLPECPLPDRR